MDNNDVIARRYTDERYLSKNELQAEMRTSLVEPYWNAVVAYREKFRRPLPFDGIGHMPLYLTATTTIREHLQAFSRKLDAFLGKLGKLLEGSEGPAIRKAILFEAMDALNIDGNFQMSQYSIKAVINGIYDDDQPFHQPLVNYYALLDELLTGGGNSRGTEDFLAHAYGVLRGEVDDLTEFYRVREIDPSIRQMRYLVDVVYSSAPLSEVESLMEAFLSFLGGSDDLPFVRAVLSGYFLSYVKPFEKDYNGMMATILLKEQYASLAKQPLAYLFPFEKLLLLGRKTAVGRLASPSEMKEQKRYENLRKEIQRSGDLTYVLFEAVEAVGSIIDSLETIIARLRLEAVKGEHRLTPEEESAAKAAPAPVRPLEVPPSEAVIEEAVPSSEPAPIYRPEEAVTPLYVKDEPPHPEPAPRSFPEPPSNFDAPAPEPADSSLPSAESHPEPEEEIPASTEVPVNPLPEREPEATSSPERKEEAPLPRKAAGRTTLEPSRIIAPEEMSGEKSLVLEPQRLNEKEAKEYMMYLLETNPSLNKKQASFLSTHCTIGRYYSIQQFKSYARVAYETARTSMDKLAALGYYEKLQVKNKFVYTPVVKGRSAK